MTQKNRTSFMNDPLCTFLTARRFQKFVCLSIMTIMRIMSIMSIMSPGQPRPAQARPYWIASSFKQVLNHVLHHDLIWTLFVLK